MAINHGINHRVLLQAHLAIGNLVEPSLFGESFELSPVVVLLSLTFWGSLWVSCDLLLLLLLLCVFVCVVSVVVCCMSCGCLVCCMCCGCLWVLYIPGTRYVLT